MKGGITLKGKELTCQKEQVNLKLGSLHCILALPTGQQVKFDFESILYSLLFIFRVRMFIASILI